MSSKKRSAQFIKWPNSALPSSMALFSTDKQKVAYDVLSRQVGEKGVEGFLYKEMYYDPYIYYILACIFYTKKHSCFF